MKEIGGYVLDRLLGRGATAQVFLGIRSRDQKKVALKIFHAGLWDQSSQRRRALAEFQAVSALHHPNIVRLVESLLDLEPPLLVFDYVDGFSLEEFQPQLPYILPEIGALIAIEVLLALEVAHEKGIIHRDLKPANILVSREGQVRVSDFGLAKMTDISRLTLSGTLLGSPDYMSPEQAKGEEASVRSDLFAVNSILYFLVTGTRPFGRHSPLATLAAVSETQFEPAQKRNPKLSGGLAKILLRGFSKDLSQRFTSAREYRLELNRYLAGVGLDSDFTLTEWLRAPTETTLSALKRIAHALEDRCVEAIAKKEIAPAMEALTHLSLVAPQSAALGSLTLALEKARRQKRYRMGWILASESRLPPAIAGSILLGMVITGIVLWQDKRRTTQVVEVSSHDLRLPTAMNPVAHDRVISRLGSEAAVRAAPVPKKRRTRPPQFKAVKLDIPAEIRLFLDGKRIGSSDHFTTQKVGRHLVRLEKDGSEPIIRSIVVKADEPTLIRAR
jgi:serine/threonine protein kinase